MTRPKPDGWLIVNPLPRALRHYESALRHEIGEPLANATSTRPDFEIAGATGLTKVAQALAALRRLLAASRDPRSALVLWPALGLADLALWRALSRSRRLVIVHDPQPLRRQRGFGRVSAALGRWGSRGRYVEVVAHTAVAAASLRGMQVRVTHILDHPVLPSRSERRRSGPPLRVMVLGQHKRARDLELLERFAECSPDDWALEIVGRGWPKVRGWQVSDRFVPEDEMTALVRSSSVVLLPYRQYFQSGIATRAFECGVPVVGARHEFLESLYGEDWPGLVTAQSAQKAEAFVRAVSAALDVSPRDPRVARRPSVAAWHRALGSPVGRSEG